MSSKCSVLRDVTNLIQKVDDFLSKPRSLTFSALDKLVAKLISIKGAIRALPINKWQKKHILNRVRQAIRILQRNNSDKISRVLAVSQILLTVRLKIEDLVIPCPQGIVTVHPSNTFSTICDFCK